MGRTADKAAMSISEQLQKGGKRQMAQQFVSFISVCTALAGLICLGAGVLGFYWGTAVIKPWPPLTWNNCVGGFFMIVFGIAMTILGLNGVSAPDDNSTGTEEYAKGINTWAGFLDNFLGRGLFICYLGLRIMPLGKYFCLMAGLALLFFGFANIVIHFLWVASDDKAMGILDKISALVGSVVVIAGGMGFYWGTKVIKPWPPLTWNNCVGGIFMTVFGLMIVVMVLSPNNAEFVPKYLLFLDTLIGRGLFFMFIGLRIIPLGQFYCLVAGMVTFSFGVLNCAIHWIFNVDGAPIRISNPKTKA
jgi:hypothetical protein